MKPGVPQRRRGIAARRSRPRTGLRLVQPRADWVALSAAILARSDGACEACGLPLPSPSSRWDRHHRKLRSQGGQDVLTNLVGLHSECHVLQPQSVHQRPEWAKQRGLIVRSQAKPEDVGLWLPDGRLVRLTEEGPYELIMRGGEA